MAELSIYRVAVQARNKPAGTYTYVITRTDDPNWAESALESYSTPEAASEAGWIALDRIRAAKKWTDHDLPQTPRDPKHISASYAEPIRGG
jgi:hypothetical protein